MVLPQTAFSGLLTVLLAIGVFQEGFWGLEFRVQGFRVLRIWLI